MANLIDIVAYCDNLTRRTEIADFKGANNGLQLQNNGSVTKIGASVDAGRFPFESAVEKGIDLLIVHHGLFWNTPTRYTASLYEKLKLAIDNNLAVYSSHLPLDAHPEIGNNRLLAKALDLDPLDWFLAYEGTPIALLAKAPDSRADLAQRLMQEFGKQITKIEFGSEFPEKIAILTGSGRSALDEMKSVGADTLITGELRQEHYNLAQEQGLNLYPCGHYATERYGVIALAQRVAEEFGMHSEFIETNCPL